MTYESWRISYQSSEQAARAAFNEVEALKAEIDGLREYMKCLAASREAYREATQLVSSILKVNEITLPEGGGKQCLAEIKAQAIEIEACEWLHNNYPKLSDPVCGLLKARANQIRQAAKGE